jgi:vancomycin permeability regulator SanA
MIDMTEVQMTDTHRRLWRRILIVLVCGIPVLGLTLIASVHLSTRGRIYTDVNHIPEQRVAVVFGAGVRPDGTPTPMLADRVEAAAALYHRGRVHKLLMTGDNSTMEYNEVEAMRRYASAQGIPDQDMALDYAGFSTYESCYRARDIFGVRRAVLVTQQFHLPRAVYTCRQLGIDVVGFGTSDWGTYRTTLMARYMLRESLATLNAMLQVHITHPQPTFLGPFEGIT